MDRRFNGKVVIVTGGGSSIGAAAALRFGAEGARVVIAGRTEERVTKKFSERIPMGRAVTADEVGDVIVFLASPEARFVNGVNLPVDGGLTASSGQPRVDPVDSFE